MNAKVLAGIGGVVVAIGFVVGLVPVSSGGAACGSVMAPENALVLSVTSSMEAVNGCSSLLSLLAIPMWVLFVLGGLVLVAAVVVAARASDRRGVEEYAARQGETGSAR